MKKNKMMRLASLVLVLVLLTTCGISATFAKYTTTASAADTARIAKFGVAIDTNGTLYSDAYAAAAVNTPSAWTSQPGTTGDLTVAALTEEDNVVAPGTASYGHGLYFSITGQPEVATKYYGEIKTRDIFLAEGTYAILTKVDDIKDETIYNSYAGRLYRSMGSYYVPVTSWDDAEYYQDSLYAISNEASTEAGGYYPVSYQLANSTGGATYTTIDTSVSSINEIAKLLAGEMTGAVVATHDTLDDATQERTYTILFEEAKVIPTNTNLGDAYHLGEHIITWEWAYGELPGDDVAGNASASDNLDTILGMLIAGVNNESFVVMVNAVGNVVPLTIDAQNHVAKNGQGTVVAGLLAKLDLVLTVTQVD